MRASINSLVVVVMMGSVLLSTESSELILDVVLEVLVSMGYLEFLDSLWGLEFKMV